MNRYVIGALAFFLTFSLKTWADCSPKDAYKAVLNIFAYDQKGKLLRSGTAFYVDEEANAVTSYEFLKDAYKAEVIDVKGNKYPVFRLLGADASTNLVKFSVKGVKKHAFFSISDAPVKKGESLQLVHYSNSTKGNVQTVSVTNDEAYNDYKYYHISAANDKSNIDCPLIDAQGRLVAVVQRNVEKKAETACAIDARFIQKLKITPTSYLNSDFKDLHIYKALPSNAKDALTYLYMLPYTDSLAYETAQNDFISQYPNMADGYMNRAAYYADKDSYSASEKDFMTALAKSKVDTTGLKTESVYYTMSDIVYRTILHKGNSPVVPPSWTFALAEEYADSAYAISPNTLYILQKGKCQFALQDYEKAYQSFSKVCEDKQFASSVTFYSAARALELSGKDSLKVIALLDSCIQYLPKPVSMRNAQYYLERSQRYIRAQKFREAVFDYNEYEQIVGPRNLSGNFYYLREQAEMSARMYQQALDDIRTAIAISKDNLFYRLEESLILLRVGEYEQAIATSTALLKDLPESPDCYKIMGIAYGQLGKKDKALENLNKAKKLGDNSVDVFIKKYQ